MFWHLKVREDSVLSGRPRGDNSFNMMEHVHYAVGTLHDLMVYAPKGEGHGSRLGE
jgi:hypothetical protein